MLSKELLVSQLPVMLELCFFKLDLEKTKDAVLRATLNKDLHDNLAELSGVLNMTVPELRAMLSPIVSTIQRFTVSLPRIDNRVKNRMKKTLEMLKRSYQ